MVLRGDFLQCICILVHRIKPVCMALLGFILGNSQYALTNGLCTCMLRTMY